MNLHNPGSGFDRYRESEIAGPGHPLWAAAGRLFGGQRARAMREAFEADFAGVKQAYPDHAGGVARFVLENRTRRRTAQNPLKAFGTFGTPLLPGLCRDIVEEGMAVPYADKAGGAFYRDLLQRVHPHALRAPLLSAGSPVARHRLDMAALALALRARGARAVTRHPRLFRGPWGEVKGKAAPLPQAARALAESNADSWISHDTLRRADPATGPGYQVWRLYFHWSAWRTLHGPRPEDSPFWSA